MGENAHIVKRLEGIRTMLVGAYQAGASMPTASKGTEREMFVEKFLCEVFTPQFRFGAGVVTDATGNESGQVDVVVEYPWIPSLPVVGSNRPRLYLAEGVAAAIEVKSDLVGQWAEVERTSAKLKKLRRYYGSGLTSGYSPGEEIPLFAVGYTGWKTIDSLRSHLINTVVDGILVIDSGLFASTPSFQGIEAEGAWSLWGLIICLHQITSVLSTTAIDAPMTYAS